MADTEEYTEKTHLEHVKLRKNMYIGDCVTMSTTGTVWTGEQMEQKEYVLNPGCMKLLRELLDNAVDNAARDPPTRTIMVTMTATTFKVENDGRRISLKQNKEGLYPPTLVFGRLLSGSNWKEDRKGVGQNGYGAKLANIFSNRFDVKCYDPAVAAVLTQTWKRGMTYATEPKVKAVKAKAPRMTTTVKVEPDMSYFDGLENLEPLMPVMRTLLVTLAATTGLKISFNGTAVKENTFKKLVESYQHENVQLGKVNGLEFAIALGHEVSEVRESWVSGTYTRKGGTHVKLIEDQIYDVVKTAFAKKKTTAQLYRYNVMSQVAIWVNLRLPAPDFDTQSKDALTSKLDARAYGVPNMASMVRKAGLLEVYEKILAQKEERALGKAMNGRKKRTINVKKLIDARQAGTRHSYRCSLMLTEGDSARTFVVSGLAVAGGERFGVLPLKGKPLNAMKASSKELAANQELQDVCKTLGLNFGKKYESERDLQTLRYGHVVVLADADVDGFHILGLVVAFFQHYFPALLKSGYVRRMITPVVVATKRAERREFFTVPDFNAFISGKSGWKVRYLKGLGSSTKAEAKAYFKSLPRYLKYVNFDDKASEAIDMFFNDKRAADRKAWMKNDAMELDYASQTQDVSAFVDSELQLFAQDSLSRAIPSFMDGLKESQRKILFGCIRKDNGSTTKIAQLASYVAEKTMYLHGEKSLADAITAMTQGFVGSNNLPLLVPEGQTGSRLQNGADAASPRYTFTKLQPYAHDLFLSADDGVLDYCVEEGVRVEPKFYVPVLPMVLINGSKGLAVGYSTVLPQHAVEDVVASIQSKLKGADFLPLTPKWNGWTGTVTEDAKAWHTHGVFEREGSTVTITELPIGPSIDKYTAHLSKLLDAGKITSFENLSTEDAPSYVLQVPANFDAKALKMTKSITKSCLNLLDEAGAIRTFESVAKVLVRFYDVRVAYYESRRLHLIKVLTKELRELDLKIKFIAAVVQGTIDVRGARDAVVAQALAIDVPRAKTLEFLRLQLLSLTEEKVQELMVERAGVRLDIEKFRDTNAKAMYAADLKRFVKTKKRKRT